MLDLCIFFMQHIFCILVTAARDIEVTRSEVNIPSVFFSLHGSAPQRFMKAIMVPCFICHVTQARNESGLYISVSYQLVKYFIDSLIDSILI